MQDAHDDVGLSPMLHTQHDLQRADIGSHQAL